MTTQRDTISHPSPASPVAQFADRPRTVRPACGADARLFGGWGIRF